MGNLHVCFSQKEKTRRYWFKNHWNPSATADLSHGTHIAEAANPSAQIFYVRDSSVGRASISILRFWVK